MAAEPHSHLPHQNPPKPRVLVIGGGLGGMAAAFSLARILGPGNVLLVEARPETGGRLRSFTDSESGDLIDNCQHLMMGCCSNLRQFTTDAGLDGAWIRQDFLTFATPDGKVSRFQADPLPPPFHLTRAFLGLHTLPFQRKIALGRAMLAMAAWKDPGTDQAVEAWLLEKGQTPSDNVAFWEPLLVSALNDSLSRLGMRAARQVVAEAFLGGKNAFDLWLPARPLGELFGENLKAKIFQAGVEVQVDHPIRNLVQREGKIVGAITRNNQLLAADQVILATSHKASWDILQASCLTGNLPSWAVPLGASSITAIHLWFDRRFIPLEHAALVGCLGHWVFRKPWGSAEDPYCQVLVSASDHILDQPAEVLIQKAANELITTFGPRNGGQESPKLLRGRVVREKSATFRQAPDLDQIRPTCTTPWPGLVLAGDYTRTGWPSTMEGAVRSGLVAARETLRLMGIPETRGRVIIKEAPRSWFQRMICRGLPY